MSQLPLIPVLFATLAASLFGAQAVLGKRGLAYVDPQTGTMITIGTAAVVYWLLSPFLMRAEYWRSPILWVFVLNGVMHPMVSLYLSFEANERMGPTVSSTVASTAPLFAAAGAVLALGERLTPTIVLGTLCTVGGIMVLTWSPTGRKRAWALSALAFPVGAAAVRAANQVLGRFMIETLPSPYFAALISFTVSMGGQLILYRLRQGRLPLRLSPAGLKWNVAGGLCVAVAILSMYTALGAGRVVVVAPIIAAYPLFTLLCAVVFRQELLGRRILAGVLLVIGGVVWISVP